MRTVPPGAPPRPCTVNGSPPSGLASMSTPSPRNPSRRGDRARAGLLVTVENHRDVAEGGQWRHEPQHSARQSAVDAGARRRVEAALDRQDGASPAMAKPRVRSAPIIRSVSRLRSAPAMREARRPARRPSAARISARLVIDFEPGTVTVACTGAPTVGADHI